MTALASFTPSDLGALFGPLASNSSHVRVKQVPALRLFTPLPQLTISGVSSASAPPIIAPLESNLEALAPTIVVSSESCSQTRVIDSSTSLNEVDSVSTTKFNCAPLRSSALSSDTCYESPIHEDDPFGVNADSWYSDDRSTVTPTTISTLVYSNASAVSSSATLVNSPERDITLSRKTSHDGLKTPGRSSPMSIKKGLKRRNALFSRPTSTVSSRKASDTSQRRKSILPSLPTASLRKGDQQSCAPQAAEHHHPNIVTFRPTLHKAVEHTSLPIATISNASTTRTSAMKCIAGGCTPDNCSHMAPLRLIDISAYRSAALKKKSLMKRSALRAMKLRIR